jgi:hypothetical protein
VADTSSILYKVGQKVAELSSASSGPLSDTGVLNGNLTVNNGDITIQNSVPVITLKDNNNSVNNSVAGYMNFKNSSDTQLGYIGYASTANSQLYITNSIGDIYIDSGSYKIKSNKTQEYPYTASVMGDYPAGSTNPDEFIFPAVGSYQSSQSYMLNTLIPFNNTSASSSVSASEYIDGTSASVGTNQSGMSRFTVVHEGMYLVNFNISARLYGNSSDTWVQVEMFKNGTKFGYSGYEDEDLSTGSPPIPGYITNENHFSAIRLRGNTADASKRFASMSLPVYFYDNDYIEFKFSRNLVAGPGSLAELTSPTYFSITRMGI